MTERRAAAAAFEPREIMQEGEDRLRIAWADGHACHYTAAALRRACPCAQCVNEWTGQRVLKPETVSDALRIEDIAIVGRYALNFRWSDGHETGIYSFRLLRQLCEEAAPAMSDAKKILVIEDDDVARELVRRVLERKGYTVITAEDGIRGYEQAEQVHPDLIITDISMPAADGVHLVRRVRDTPEISETPILVMTGFGTGNATLSLAQGATAYEPKPIDPESFLATVERLLTE